MMGRTPQVETVNQRAERSSDRTKVGDALGPEASVALLSEMGQTGLLVIERFTGPEDDPNRPLELMELGRQLDLIDAVGRGEKISYGSAAWLASREPLPSWTTADQLEAELRSYLAETRQVHNLITQVGDQYYGERASGIGSPPGQVTGMRLGTGVTAVAKTGAGAAIVTYKTGSFKAIDGGFPTSALNGASRQIQWKTSWGAGVVNGSALAEVVITNESPLTDVAGSAADTISRALFGPMTLGALDTLSITWSHLLLGA